ncbi:MAG TPA: aspartate-semialdehyde dehydrogenase [Candidatus Binataceae bacterium]|nr:aspartate-semialdehyde dehydrogenase [Candidatus Binataceae bacterium]
MASGQRIAVVGATGAVGQTTLRLLKERNFPVRDLRAFASARSEGKTVRFGDEDIKVQRLGADSFKGIDIALFSAGSDQSREFAPAAVKAGAVVVDKSSAFRMHPEVPLIVPEINPAAAKAHRGILACPNCTTIVTVMPLKPLHDAGRLRRVIATSFQAVSGAGVAGVTALREETLAWARGEKIEPRHFPHQIAFNLIPHIDKFGADGYTGEELKLVGEIRKILGLPELAISPTTVRVPVFTAHSIAVNAETESKVTAAAARAAFERFPGLRVVDDPAHNRYPMPLIAEGQDDCMVGRIREDLGCANALNFWVSGDQLRKGAALNGIQIAELLIA